MQAQRQNNTQTEAVSEALINTSIDRVVYLIDSYIIQLNNLKEAHNINHFSEMVSAIRKNDSILGSAQIVQATTSNPPPLLVKPIFTDGDSHILVRMATDSTKQAFIELHIPLSHLHDQLAEQASNTYAYNIVIADDRFVYHPDETMLGKYIGPIPELDAIENSSEKVIKTESDYLQMPVYASQKKFMFGEQEWKVTGNVPRILYTETLTNTRNTLLLITTIAILAFLLIFWLGARQWQIELLRNKALSEEKMALELQHEQQKQNALQMEVEYLRSGLNPHFLLNALGSLQVLVNKDTTQASTFVQHLSVLYRYLLLHEKSTTVTLKAEMAFTENYLALQHIRFKEQMQVNIDIPDNYLHRNVPPVSIQLLIENCLKHTRKTSANPLIIDIYIEDDYLVVRNTYNPPEVTYKSGMGLNNLRRRYEILTSKPCSFDVIDNHFVAKIPLV